MSPGSNDGEACLTSSRHWVICRRSPPAGDTSPMFGDSAKTMRVAPQARPLTTPASHSFTDGPPESFTLRIAPSAQKATS